MVTRECNQITVYFYKILTGVITSTLSHYVKVLVVLFVIKGVNLRHSAQIMKFLFTDFLGKCDQIRSFLWIWLHLLKKWLIENFMFYAVA